MLSVSDIMTREPVTVNPETPLGEAIGLMKTTGCRQLPVVEGDQVIGMVTDRDVRLAMNSPLVLHEREDDYRLLNATPVKLIMAKDPVAIEADAPAQAAAEILRAYKFGALPVVNGKKLVGIVSVSDILDSYIQLLVQRFS